MYAAPIQSLIWKYFAMTWRDLRLPLDLNQIFNKTLGSDVHPPIVPN